MRKLSLFLILFLLSIIPFASAGTTASYSTAVGTDAQINTKLTAGTATGTFVGFSSTSHDTTSGGSGLTPITVLNLDLAPKTPTEAIIESDKMTASGSFYAYWNNAKAMKISLSWTVPTGISITVKKGTDEIESATSTEIATVAASTSSSVTIGSQQISVETENLLDKIYGASYTIEFTIKAEAQS